MKKFLTVSTAVAALMLGVSGASALDERKGMYVTGEGENRMVMGGDMTEGARVLQADNGAAPSDCPEGSFYEMNEMIIACGDDGAQYNVREMEAGMMMSDGQAYPEGAMMLEQRENQQ